MIYKVYSVFDSCAKAYLLPMFFPTKGQAIRALTEAVNDKEHQFGKYPEEYVLFELGEYDDSMALFEMYEAPRSVGVCIEFVRPSE